MQRWKSLDPLSSGHSLIWYEPLKTREDFKNGWIIQATYDMEDRFLCAPFERATMSRLYRIAVLKG